MPKEMMNTKEVAEYLDIHEKQVYLLIKENKIPCTKITGKWIFPKQLIDEWILRHSMEQIKSISSSLKQSGAGILAAGSNDPLLDIMLNELKQLHPVTYIFATSTGSKNGLYLLNKGLVDVAWSHLYDSKSDSYNIPFIKEICTNREVVAVHLFNREIGLLIAPTMQDKIKNFTDISRPDVVFVNRQDGSGIRQLTDMYCEKYHINPDSINGYSNTKYSHIEIGLAIQSGEAHCGIASVAIANFFKLPFIPLANESFDMIIAKDIFFNKTIQSFLKLLHDNTFINKIKTIGNYNFTNSGDIIYASNQNE
ncbi:MAG: helix-turn-helix transcriptional regulator [Spirochaetota bacterium]